MTYSSNEHLPESARLLLDGSELRGRAGQTFLLLTTDQAGWPHMAMLSVGEVVAIDARTLRAAVWLHSSTSNNLTRDGRGVLSFVVDGRAYTVRLTATRVADLDPGSDGQLAQFIFEVRDVREDTADYAQLISGVTFRLNEPDRVIPRWERTVAALLAAASSTPKKALR
jgi:hypothetical protein